MVYENEIKIHKDCIKFLKKLEPKLKEKVKTVISSLVAFPLVKLDVVKLRGFENVFRARVGKVRILFEYEKSKRRIWVRKIEFRGRCYK